MAMSEGPSFISVAGRLAAAAGIAILGACAAQPGAGTAASAAAPAAGPAATVPAAAPAAAVPAPAATPPPAAAGSQVTMEPPDGKWLTDDQGRQYFVQEFPKVEGWYHWLNEEKTQVRVQYGLVFDVVSHDAERFQVKVYKVAQETAPTKPQGPTAEEKEQLLATYANKTGASDRLVFEPFGRGLPNRGQWRNGFKIVDMNGDGHPDIVHGPARKSNSVPLVFLGDGKGNWKRWSGLSFPPLGYDYGDVAVADFNGDGRLDMALAVHLHGLLVLVADGPLSFKEWGKGVEFRIPGNGGDVSGFSSRTLEAADWNGDGRPDLISIGEGPRMAGRPGPGEGDSFAPATAYGALVYLNQGDGTWGRQDEQKSNPRLFGEDIAVADFTNDGHLDMLLGSSVLGASELLRIGAGKGDWTEAVLPGLRPTSYVGAVDVADFNRDGRPDLVVGYLARELGAWRTGIDLFLAKAAGGWERKPVAMVDGRPWLTALDSGDLDGDGRLDLAAVTGEGEIWLFLGKGDGSFDREASPEIPPYGEGCRGYDIKIANLDGDPAGELVAEFAGEPSALFAPTQCLNEGGMVAFKAAPKK